MSLLIGCCEITQAQDLGNDCSGNLAKAQTSYNKGNIEQAISLLKPCLLPKRESKNISNGEGLSNNERLNGLRLLTICHLFLQNDSAAIVNMARLLRHDPEYQLKGDDPLEFRYLYETFRTTPNGYINAKLGANLTLPRVIKSFTIDHNRIGEVQDAYSSRLDGGIVGGYDLPLNFFSKPAKQQKKRKSDIKGFFVLQLELGFQRHTYYYEHKMQTDPSLGLDYTTVLFRERQNWIDLPFALKYTFPSKQTDLPGYKTAKGFWKFKRIVPFLYVGGQAHWLVQGRFSSLNRIADNRQLSNPPVIELTVIDKDDKQATTTSLPRKRYNVSFMGGIGGKWWAGRDYITVELRYSQKLINFIQPRHRYQNQTLSHLFGYVDSDALLQHFTLLVGYQHPVFAPKQVGVKHWRQRFGRKRKNEN